MGSFWSSRVLGSCRCFGLALGFWIVLLPAFAHAQQLSKLSLNPLAVTHSDRRPNNLSNDVIGAADCQQFDVMSFPLTLSQSQGMQLEAWAGVGCGSLQPRVATGELQCWRLEARAASDGLVNLSLPVRDILYGRSQAAQPELGPIVDFASSDPTLACQDSVPSSAGETLDVFFLLVDPSNEEVTSSETYQLQYKLTAPPAPDVITVSSWPDQLSVHFSYSAVPADTTIADYALFCDPAPGTSDAPVANDGTCTASSALMAGDAADEQAFCGATSSTLSLSSTRLSPGVAYHVAVAAIDAYGNSSALSPVACGVPTARVDRTRGCAFSAARSTPPLAAAWTALSLLLLCRRRAADPRRISGARG